MKKIKALLAVAFIFSYGITAAQQNHTLTHTAGPWQVWIGATPPSDWKTNTGNASGWQNPRKGNPTSEQRQLFDDVFHVTSSEHYVWDETDLGTAYFRLKVDIDEDAACSSFGWLSHGDDVHTVWVNGVEIGSTVNETGILWKKGLHKKITQYLKCGQTNIIAVKAEDLSLQHAWFIGNLVETEKVEDLTACFSSNDCYFEDEPIIFDAGCSDEHNRYSWEIYSAENGWTDRGERLAPKIIGVESEDNHFNVATTLDFKSIIDLEATEIRCFYVVLNIRRWCCGELQSDHVIKKICIRPRVTASVQVDCETSSAQLFGTDNEFIDITWTGPNGFSTTDPNPVITESGVYTYTAKLNDLSFPCDKDFVKRVFVYIPEDCCDETIYVKDRYCPGDEITFSISSYGVSHASALWYVDGVYKAKGTTFQTVLPSGTYEICVHYLGNQKNNPEIICCEQKCTTIVIDKPVLDQFSQTLTICDGEELWLDPCKDYPDATNYALSGPGISYSSKSAGGCGYHKLKAGNYILYMENENGCPIRNIIYTVVEQPTTEQVCHLYYSKDCDEDLELNLGLDQNSCPFLIDAEWLVNPQWYDPNTGIPLQNGIVTNHDQGQYYQFHYVDKTTCTKYVVVAQIERDTCCLDPCFILPTTICETDPLIPDLSCMQQNISSYRWVIHELDPPNPWIVKHATQYFTGSVAPINFKEEWSGWEAGKSYTITLDVFLECDGETISTTVQRTFTIEPLMIHPLTIYRAENTEFDLAFLNEANLCDGDLQYIVNLTDGTTYSPVPNTFQFSVRTELRLVYECCIVDLVIEMSDPDAVPVQDDGSAHRKDEVNIDRAMVVYPNPTSGIITIIQPTLELKNLDQESIQVEVLDVKGAVVFTKTVNKTEADLTLDMNHLAEGTYSVRLIYSGHAYQKQVVLK